MSKTSNFESDLNSTHNVTAETHRDPMSFFLDKWSGKMCVNIEHELLAITQLETDYWKKSICGYPVLGHVHWLEVHGKIPTSRLSPDTAYEAYLVFTLSDYVCYGFHIPIEASVGIPGKESTKEILYLDPRIANSKINHHYPNTKPRERDSYTEVKLGEYFNKKGENRDVDFERSGKWNAQVRCPHCWDGDAT